MRLRQRLERLEKRTHMAGPLETSIYLIDDETEQVTDLATGDVMTKAEFEELEATWGNDSIVISIEPERTALKTF